MLPLSSRGARRFAGLLPDGAYGNAVEDALRAAVQRVAIDEVLAFEAADKYVRVLTGGREFLIRTPLKELLPQLDENLFWQVLGEIRHRSDTPVIMLTAKGETIDKVLGLKLGADDYLTKPVRGRVLETRIKTLLRRSSKGHSPLVGQNTLRLGMLEICKSSRSVNLKGEAVNLSSNEFVRLYGLLLAKLSDEDLKALADRLKATKYFNVVIQAQVAVVA